LKKLLIYSVAAVALGLSLTLIPLITLAEIKAENRGTMLYSISKQVEELEGPHADIQKPPGMDFEILTISFVIALVAYALFKRRRPYHDYRWIGPYLY